MKGKSEVIYYLKLEWKGQPQNLTQRNWNCKIFGSTESLLEENQEVNAEVWQLVFSVFKWLTWLILNASNNIQFTCSSSGSQVLSSRLISSELRLPLLYQHKHGRVLMDPLRVKIHKSSWASTEMWLFNAGCVVVRYIKMNMSRAFFVVPSRCNIWGRYVGE